MENISAETISKSRTKPKKHIYMEMLQSLFKKPLNLVNSASLSLRQKRFLLKKWYEDRENYIFENYGDPSEVNDKEMERLMRAMREVKDNYIRYN